MLNCNLDGASTGHSRASSMRITARYAMSRSFHGPLANLLLA
jgi:hypothetical protein